MTSRTPGRFTVELAVAPRTAFDYLADPRNRPQWQSSLRGVHLVDSGPPRVGTRWIDLTAVGARPHLRIVEMLAPGGRGEPGVWAEVGAWHGLRARLSLTFTPLPGEGHTLLGVHLHIDGTRPWLVVRLVLQALAPPALRADLRRAGRILQAGE